MVRVCRVPSGPAAVWPVVGWAGIGAGPPVVCAATGATDAGGGPTDVRASAVGNAWASGGAADPAACLRRGTSRRTRAGTWESPRDVRRGRPAAPMSCGYRVGSRTGAGALMAAEKRGPAGGGHALGG